MQRAKFPLKIACDFQLFFCFEEVRGSEPLFYSRVSGKPILDMPYLPIAYLHNFLCAGQKREENNFVRCAPHKMYTYFLYILSRSCGFAKMTAKQPTGLFAPFESLIFSCRRLRIFLRKMLPAIGLLQAYDSVDVRFSRVCCKFTLHKIFHAVL